MCNAKKEKCLPYMYIYIVPLFSIPFICFSLGLTRENNAYFSEEKVRSIRNDNLMLQPTL